MIKGYDSEGKEIFSHTYHYVGMEEVRGLYEFESDDADSGEFTYFCIAPDTNDTKMCIRDRVYSVIDSRYRSGKPLIATTNRTLEELQHLSLIHI